MGVSGLAGILKNGPLSRLELAFTSVHADFVPTTPPMRPPRKPTQPSRVSLHKIQQKNQILRFLRTSPRLHQTKTHRTTRTRAEIGTYFILRNIRKYY